MSEPARILVIKLGALGDFIYALGAMKAIRAHHPGAKISLLTRKPYEELARKSGFFDEIMLDTKPKLNPFDWIKFRELLNSKRFARVYDLQNNDRTGLYFKLFSPKPEWSGIVNGASHRNADPERPRHHAFQGHQKTLKLAGIEDVKLNALEWLHSDIARFNLPKPYALLVPGSSANHLRKRWPESSYRALVQKLIDAGLHPVLLGAKDEIELAGRIAEGLEVTNLAGQTTIDDLATVARGAAIAVGNDTGPMHILSMTGCPVVMFFCSDESNIKKHGPQTSRAKSFEAQDLNQISIDDVFENVRALMRAPAR